MTADRFERQLPQLLNELGQPRVPDYFDDILRQTARTRQRPRWSFPERWIQMDIAAQVPIGARLVPLRTIVAVALLIAALAAAAIAYIGSQPRPAPLFGPAGNGVVIVSRNGDIFASDETLGRERLLIGGASEDIAARFSSDGRTIFFGRVTPEGTVVMAANADGTNIRPVSDTLLHENEGVEVSPDATKLLVLNTSGSTATLEVHPLTIGEDPLVLELGGIVPLGFARWGRGEDEIVFRGYSLTTSIRGFYAVKTDGTGPRPLLEVSNIDGLLNDPEVSQDGRLLAYWNDETEVVPGRTCNVHVLDLTSGRDQPLVFDASAECESAPIFIDDDRLLLERVTGSSWQLIVAPVDGGEAARPVGPIWEMETAIWWELSPDRSSVLFASTDGQSQVAPIEGGGTSREIAIEHGDFVSWQRLPVAP